MYECRWSISFDRPSQANTILPAQCRTNARNVRPASPIGEKPNFPLRSNSDAPGLRLGFHLFRDKPRADGIAFDAERHPLRLTIRKESAAAARVRKDSAFDRAGEEDTPRNPGNQTLPGEPP
jgi:hypothetical protein